MSEARRLVAVDPQIRRPQGLWDIVTSEGHKVPEGWDEALITALDQDPKLVILTLMTVFRNAAVIERNLRAEIKSGNREIAALKARVNALCNKRYGQRTTLRRDDGGRIIGHDTIHVLFDPVRYSDLIGDGGTHQTQYAVALHTTDPSGKDQMAQEAAYVGYSRAVVTESAGGWSAAGTELLPATDGEIDVTFPQCRGGDETVTHFTLGPRGGGQTEIIRLGPLDEPLKIYTGMIPSLRLRLPDLYDGGESWE
jgi:hypothetical protein